jgi:predicted secreted protein
VDLLPMKWTSVLAIYTLFWVACAFVQLPFGVKTHDEAGIAKVKGQADSAPANFRPGRIALRATVLAALVTALFVLNYSYRWIEIGDLEVFPAPPDEPAYKQLEDSRA